MALTAQDMSSMGRLAQLAANPQGVGRDEIYVAVASLYRAQSAYLTDRERGLMRDILLRLSHDVEMAVRIALAERLADDEEAPVDLILMLCDDSIEVARPVILRSRRLTDANILKFLEQASVAHQEAIAQRPNIGEPVTGVLAKSEIETVLIALVRNMTARIGPDTFQTLIDKSRRIQCLQTPLVHRKDLPAILASQMTEWVSDALKTHIAANFKMSPAKAEAALEQATHQIRVRPAANPDAGGDSSQKLVEKLFTAGQLKAGFLLRVLHQGQIDLFDIAFARLVGVEVNTFKRAFYQHGPRAVALACRAAGIDRAVFPTVFSLSRQARAVPPAMSPEQHSEVENVFNVFTRADAIAIFRAQHAAAR